MFNPAEFRVMFPAFADPATYPDATLTGWATMAQCSITESCALTGDCFDLAVNLLTAHIGTLLTRAASGMASGVVTSATIDKVAVGFAPPPFRSQWAFWLAQTPYGVQLQGMLSVQAVGGFYFPGTRVPELSGFRRAGGRFTP
jgi:hypothetical protein